MWEGIVGKLQDGCLGGVVKTLLLFVFVFVLSDDALKTIVVDDGFGDGWLKKEVDMIFYIYAIYTLYILII